MNIYYQNGSECLRRSLDELSKTVSDRINGNNFDVINCTLYYAIGLEKILKGFLYDINPTFIYKQSDFSNVVPIVYKDAIIDKKNKEIKDKPDEDTITLKIAIFRSKLFSTSVLAHSNMLFALSNYRDIIVHNTFDQLSNEKLEKVVKKDCPRSITKCKKGGA